MFGSLFEFAKDVGTRLFTSDAEAAMSILKHIEANNPGVNPLDVKYDGGCVTLSGSAESMAAKEKCVLMAGNVRGVEKVVADGLRVDRQKEPTLTPAPNAAAATTSTPSVATSTLAPEPAPAEPESRFYTIQKGDTLWKIAATALGKGARYPEIFEANREVILDPDKIYPGQKIRIPG